MKKKVLALLFAVAAMLADIAKEVIAAQLTG